MKVGVEWRQQHAGDRQHIEVAVDLGVGEPGRLSRQVQTQAHAASHRDGIFGEHAASTTHIETGITQGAVKDANFMGANLGSDMRLLSDQTGAAGRDHFHMSSEEFLCFNVEQPDQEVRFPRRAALRVMGQHLDLHVGNVQVRDADGLPQQWQ